MGDDGEGRPPTIHCSALSFQCWHPLSPHKGERKQATELGTSVPDARGRDPLL